jgi:hypothetical protein
VLLRTITPTGEVAGADVAVAPIQYGDSYDVRVAARDDGFLVTYNDWDGLHARHLDATAALANEIVVPPDAHDSHYDALIAIREGYTLIGYGKYAVDIGYRLPRVLAFGSDGTAVQSPRWLDLPPTLHGVGQRVAAAGPDRWAAAWPSEEWSNSTVESQIQFRSPCGPPFGDPDPVVECSPDASAAPVPNEPYPAALFYPSGGTSIVLSKAGSACDACGETLSISFVSPDPLCAPQTLEWDVSQSGPNVGLCASPDSLCVLALAGRIEFVAADPAARVAGSYWFDFGQGQTVSGTFDAVHCDVPGGVTFCSAP